MGSSPLRVRNFLLQKVLIVSRTVHSRNGCYCPETVDISSAYLYKQKISTSREPISQKSNGMFESSRSSAVREIGMQLKGRSCDSHQGCDTFHFIHL